MSLEKYKGIIPAFYACYDDEGNISKERTMALTEFLIENCLPKSALTAFKCPY